MYLYRKKTCSGDVRRWLLSLAVSLLLSGSLYANQEQDLLASLERINQQIVQSLEKRNQQVDQADFSGALETTNGILDQLDVLIDALMPLGERIQKLVEKESELILKTDERGGSEQKNDTMLGGDLVVEQIKTREKTEMASKLAFKQSEQQNAGAPGQGGIKAEEGQTEVLKEVSQLLSDSADLQTSAVDRLEEEDYPNASTHQKEALVKLEQALEKLKRDSSTNQNSQDQQEQQQGQSSENQSSQDQKETSPEQKSNKQSQDELAESEQQKMSPEEALKQLMKMRQKAEDEKKRREKQFAVPQEQRRVPVDKDW